MDNKKMGNKPIKGTGKNIRDWEKYIYIFFVYLH